MASLPNFNALLMEGFSTGRELKRQDGERNALAGLVNGDESALGQLATYNPQMAFQIRGQQQQSQAAQAKAQREQMGLIAKLTSGVSDEASYQQALAAARTYKLDVANAPPAYDPEWVGQMNLVAKALSDEGALPGIAQELQAAGFKPGTPEFQQGLIGIINNKYASEYVDEQGNTRRRSTLNIAPSAGQTQQPQPAPQTQAPQPFIPGNLPTGIRYKVTNPDGSVSTVRTMSIGTDGGEVLIPTVINGKVVSEQEAIDHFYKTGENFGTFRTPEEATAYAEALHRQHEQALSGSPRPSNAQSARDMSRVLQSLGPQGFVQWQRQHNVPVQINSQEEAAMFPAGTQYIAPDGTLRVKK